jgi:hypothetical protein
MYIHLNIINQEIYTQLALWDLRMIAKVII